MSRIIFQILSDFFARYGYWAVFLGVMAENVGIPVPGETVLLFAGFLAFHGKLQLWPAILIAMTGAAIGSILGYGLGWYGGTPLVNRLLRRFHWLAKRYDNSQVMFRRHAHWAVFASRFITGLRIFAGILAGVLRMPFSTFVLFSFSGAVCWAIVIGYVGFLFGGSWDTLVAFVGRMDRIALAALALSAAILVVAYKLRRKKTA